MGFSAGPWGFKQDVDGLEAVATVGREDRTRADERAFRAGEVIDIVLFFALLDVRVLLDVNL